MRPKPSHWADVLSLRGEITDTAGQIADLQMSLYSAVYTDRDVPYQDPRYYAAITEPTVGLVRFMGAIARRLGTNSSAGKALFHLDQGMGGGKSHALVGLYHLANSPDAFLATDLGLSVRADAEASGGSVELDDARAVVLSADNMTPGATSPEFGPATSIYERFLWSLFRGDKARYAAHLADGPNKAALARALEAVGCPVLILLDELMDYAMLLSDKAHVESMPGEQAFLNSLMDAVDDVARVAFVVVMIRSDLDERGYTVAADSFRAYVATRLERNGTTVAVTEAQDFSAIIRRRLFEPADELPISAVAAAWRDAADTAWRDQVFDKLGASGTLNSFDDRLTGSYPFAPDLMSLVRDDWSRHAGFQRVRSTVEIFAATAFHWSREHRDGNWAPPLIGVGDLPLHVVIEQILSSGLLHGNERAIQGYRQVAAADIITKDATKGRAVDVDKLLLLRDLTAGQPHPALRMATALFCYSLVPRAQAKRGATKPELLAALFGPSVEFQAVEEVFNTLTSDEEGLGALEVTDTLSGRVQARYHLAVTQTLRMFFKQAKGFVQAPDRDRYIWERAKSLATASQGHFDQVIAVAQPDVETAPLSQVFGDVDQNSRTRLVVLDPRRWTLLDGRDTQTRSDLLALFGVGDSALPVDNAASCVVACVNTQRRESVRKRATEALAWKVVVDQLDADEGRREEAKAEFKAATEKADSDLLKAYQHYAFLTRTDQVEVDWQRFDDDTKSALKGSHVWDAIVRHGRAVFPGKLSGAYIATLLGRTPRALTLREITQQFFKNPAYPMVPSVDDVRRAIFEMLNDSSYVIADATGNVLPVASEDELTIGSMELYLRPATAGSETGEDDAGDAPEGRPPHTGPATGGQPEAGRQPTKTYRRYELGVPNRSLTDVNTRRGLANLFQAVLDAVDPDTGGDVQLIDFELSLTADAAAVKAIEGRARDAGADWQEDDVDF